MKKNLLLILANVLFAAHYIIAVPAVSWPVNYTLPDGTEMTINLHGDEFVSWAVSQDGYTLLFNEAGYLEYAVQDNSGELTLSGVRAHNESAREATEQKFLSQQPKGLRYTKSQLETMQKLHVLRQDVVQKSAHETPQRAHIGTKRVPLILVEFKDKTFQKTKNDFNLLMNQLNYTEDGITGSVHDYYLANSYGQCEVKVDVFGPYKMPLNIKAYDFKSTGGNSAAMATEAARQASNDGCDFSIYANSSDIVDNFHIIFAGYGQEAGAAVGTAIWSHAMALTGFTLNNVSIAKYSCSPELRGNTDSNITYIGVIAHELGHAMFGLPDFYNTVESSDAVDIGSWDLMASGSWNDDGRTPAYFSAYGRDYCGWVPTITLESPQTVVLPNPDDEGIIYRVNTNSNGEYFLLENRQQVGWDKYIPSSGLLIYHVDKNVNGWQTNRINTISDQRGYYVKQAGCPGGKSDCDDGRTTDPFPQTGKTSFTDQSVPNAKSRDGVNTDKPITDITHSTEKKMVAFKFMNGPSYIALSQTDTFTFPNAEVGYSSQTPLTVTVTNTHSAPVDLSIKARGGNSGSFILSKSSINGLNPGDSTTFTVTPKNGLSKRTYSTTIAVMDDMVSGTFDVKFTIIENAAASEQPVISTDNALKAWKQNAVWHISGLVIGQPWRVYSISGALVYQGIAASDVELLQSSILSGSGTYIIQTENKSIKIVH